MNSIISSTRHIANLWISSVYYGWKKIFSCISHIFFTIGPTKARWVTNKALYTPATSSSIVSSHSLSLSSSSSSMYAFTICDKQKEIAFTCDCCRNYSLIHIMIDYIASTWHVLLSMSYSLLMVWMSTESRERAIPWDSEGSTVAILLESNPGSVLALSARIYSLYS